MSIIARQRGDYFRAGKSIVTVLDIRFGSVTVGIEVTLNDLCVQAKTVERPLRGEHSGYYLFRQNGLRLLVLELSKGHRFQINPSIAGVVLDINRYGVIFDLMAAAADGHAERGPVALGWEFCPSVPPIRHPRQAVPYLVPSQGEPSNEYS